MDFKHQDIAHHSFLVGAYRTDKPHLEWILGKSSFKRKYKLYNTRYNTDIFSLRNGGTIPDKIPEYIIIYNAEHPQDDFHLFKCSKASVKDQAEMEALKYPNPKGNYVLYTLGEELNIENLNIIKLLSRNDLDGSIPFSPIFFNKGELHDFLVNDNPQHSNVKTKKTPQSRTLTHIDCFSGPGGICTGLAAAGFDTKVAIEYIESCCETYSYNHPDVKMIHSDIRNVKEDDIVPFIPAEGIDLVTSGMPCETFSTAGNTSRSFYDDRQFLFREGIRIAKIANAKMILFENVPGITSKTVSKEDPTLIIDVLKKELIEAGYSNFIEVVLDATKFGVPQKRNRYFILASRSKEYNLFAPKSFKHKIRTVGDALCDLPNVVPNERMDPNTYNGKDSEYTLLLKDRSFWKRESFTDGLTLQTSMNHRPNTIKRFSLLGPGEGLKDLFEKYTGEERELLQKERILPKKLFIKRNVRLRMDEPCATVTSHCLDEFVHPVYDRALTVRECARLQSFPDSYFFAGPYIVPHIDRTVQDKYEQIGDAVPPLLAYAWGCTINEIFSNHE